MPVALSFDNGPDPEVTPRVLDVLAKHDIRGPSSASATSCATPIALRSARGRMLKATGLAIEVHQILVEGAFTCVLWNIVPRDWAMPNRWVESASSQCASVERSPVVLHDPLAGAMDHLDRFIGAAKDRGMTFVQDLPADCMPIEKGIDRKDVSGITSA